MSNTNNFGVPGLDLPVDPEEKIMELDPLRLMAEYCERAKTNKEIYNISEARYCREVCQFNRDGVCAWNGR